MPSLWSPHRDVSPETSRLLIERAHEEFVHGNDTDARLDHVRAVVRESWRRSVEHLVGVEALPPLDLDPEAVRAHRRVHPLADVMDMIRGLLIPGDAEDSGVVVAVGDASGRLLWVEGDRRIRSLTGAMGFVPGANWSEDAVGTAAPGIALRLDRSVQIHGAEHFNRLVQPWSCTAVPVHDPETRRILGVIDVTGTAPAVTAQAQLLVDATARAVEGELLLTRMRHRATAEQAGRASGARRRGRSRETGAVADTLPTLLRVLGRDRAVLDLAGRKVSERSASDQSVVEIERTSATLSARHAEILLMLATHRQGLSADRLAALVYGHGECAVTLRAEMVRLRKVLARVAPQITLETRPYRLTRELETDAHQMISLLDRGAHRVALAAYVGDVLPDSVAPGVEQFREATRTALRESLLTEARIDVLMSYAETDGAADDLELFQACLRMLPARSPKRAGLVARIEALIGPPA